MGSSKVSCMLVSLLLFALVLFDMDKALGEPIQLRNRKLKVTEHHDQVTTDQSLAVFPKNWWESPKVREWVEKAADLVDAIPIPPSSPVCKRNDDECLNILRKLLKVLDQWKAVCKNTSLVKCKRTLKVLKRFFDLLKAKSH